MLQAASNLEREHSNFWCCRSFGCCRSGPCVCCWGFSPLQPRRTPCGCCPRLFLCSRAWPAPTSSSRRFPAHRDKVQRRLAGRQTQQTRHFGVVESAHRRRPQPQGCCLQQQVLGSVTGFHVHIALTALAVAGSGAFEHGGDHHHHRRLAHPFLVDGGLGQLPANISIGHGLQAVLARTVAIHTGG